VQESDREFLAIGVPVRDVHARTVAGLQVCGPQRRMEEVMDETIKQAIAAAQVISAALGGPGRRPPTAPSPDTRSVTGKAGA
jgi:DNA-binding IclR family transcriptional regulator